MKFVKFFGLKSRMYSLVDVDGEEIKIKNVAKNTRSKQFVDVLFNKILIRHRMKRIIKNWNLQCF